MVKLALLPDSSSLIRARAVSQVSGADRTTLGTSVDECFAAPVIVCYLADESGRLDLI